ncbi:MAG: hypothetical protein M1817_004594 [Caeruleum heppii]|nr:MAG: hypothetical protein M1817_004594 [Caeruleum heppii]
MLDDLDGQAEQLPDQWIDAVERLESEYAEWKLQVEQSELQHGITAHATLSSQVEVQDAEGGHGVDGEHIGYGGDVAIKEHPTTPPNRDLEAPSVPSSPISDLDSTEKFTKPLRSYERPNLYNDSLVSRTLSSVGAFYPSDGHVAQLFPHVPVGKSSCEPMFGPFNDDPVEANALS